MKTFSIILAIGLAGSVAWAAAPESYYSAVDTSDATTLRTTLHNTIKGHTRISFDSQSAQVFAILEDADEDPNDPAYILDLYMNESELETDGGTGDYDREHVWPKSIGFPENSGLGAYPHSDLHHLFLANGGYNSSRNNKYYDNCSIACTEKPTLFNEGRGGGTGVYPGNSNWTDPDSWEVWIGRRGDAARALFYMDVRYEGDPGEPDLRLTDTESLILSSETGANLSVAYMGLLSVVRGWHTQDPVDSLEMHHTDVVFAAQHNRNPFVDHPEYADCIYNGNCTMVAPIHPANFFAAAGDGFVSLSWSARPETDLAGYNIYRSTTNGSGYSKINSAIFTGTNYMDGTVTNGITYYYVVTALDTDSNESDFSAQRAAQAGATGAGFLIQESFETTGSYTFTPMGAEDGTDNYFNVYTVATKPTGMTATTTGIDGTHFVAGQDTNGTGSAILPTSGIFTITLNPGSVTGASNLKLIIGLSAKAANVYDTAANSSNGDYLEIFANLDGTETLVGRFTRVGDPPDNNGRLGVDTDLDGLGDVEVTDYASLADYMFSIPGSGNALTIKLVSRFESGSEEVVFDNIRVTGDIATSVGEWWILQ